MPMCERVAKIAKHCIFPVWFGAPEGFDRVGSLKRRVRSQLARCEMKSCTPLWREAHFNMLKAPGVRTILGQFLEIKMLKKCVLVVARSTFPIKMYKHTSSGPLWQYKILKRVHAVVARSTFPSQNTQNHHIVHATFGGSDVEKSARRLGREHTVRNKNVQSTSGSGVRTTLLEVQMSLRRFAASPSLHYTTFTLHHTPPNTNYTTLHYITLH